MQLFKQLRWYFIREWKKYLGSIILLACIAILQLIPPKIVGIIIDCIVKKNMHSIQILPWISIIILISIIIYILRYLWRILLFGASYQLATELRVKFYHYLSQQNQNFFLKNRTGDLIARATNDVDRVVFAAGEGVLTLVDSLVMGCLVLIIMSTKISFILTLFALIPMPIMAILIQKYGEKLHYNFSQSQSAFSLLNTQTQEILTNIRMIKAFGIEKKQIEKFYKAVLYTGQKNMDVAKIDSCFDPVIYLSVAFSNLLAIVGGSWLIIKNIITIGELTSFIMYLGLMIWPMLALAWMFNIVERGSAAWNRINLIMQIKGTKIQTESQEIPYKPGILKINIHSFYYPQNNYPALKNIKVILHPGKILGVCGPTGSGKSTFLNLIQRQFNIQKGQITYHSLSLLKFNIDDWRRRIAVVNQNVFLFSDTIANNIALGNPYVSQKKIEDAAKLANVHQDILNFSKGYQTQIGERGVILSGGQKQRISIARALLLNTEILILDDALSAVDGQTEHNILKNINNWKKNGHTLIITAHRLSALFNADEIIVIKNGMITQRGNHYKLKKEENWYKSMYHYQKLKIE
ncbi:SmdA family multidrug ABC transporter permease/ATP-binding protein [Buchnera aphidicola]|uniref:SmdA family multidrug ABC transporter permease/ATP-binding protein n=1 Tax=Buchnera aphidicola TaxID=9 RepID=UPI003BEEDD1E